MVFRRGKKRVKKEARCVAQNDSEPVESVECLEPEEFLSRFRHTASERLCSAYLALHPLDQSATTGTVTSTLCEDVFSLIECQVNLMEEYLLKSKLRSTPGGNKVLIDCLLCIVRNLWYKHMRFRDYFVGDLEQSCASANDYYRMMESLEQLLSRLRRCHPALVPNSKGVFDNPTASVLHQETTELLSLLSSDAVYSAQRAHSFVIREIHQSKIASELFTRDWEDRYVNNEVAVSLVKTMEEYVYEFHNYLSNDLLYRKAVDVLVKAIVCFYIRCLVQRADDARRGKTRNSKRPFVSPRQAVTRMMYDIQTLRDYFYHLVKKIPSLARAVECEVDVLVVVHECLGVAAGNHSTSSLEEFIVVLHKRSGGNYDVTRHLMGDLWYLAAPMKRRHEIFDTIGLMQAELQVLSSSMEEQSMLNPSLSRDPLEGLQLSTALQQIYEERILQERSSICAPCIRAASGLSSLHTNHEQQKLLVAKQQQLQKENSGPRNLMGEFLMLLKLHRLRLNKGNP